METGRTTGAVSVSDEGSLSLLTPLPGKILVELEPAAPQERGGIVIPETAIERRGLTAKVVASNAQSDEDAGEPMAGKRVLLSPYSRGEAVKFGSGECQIVRADEVLAILEGSEEVGSAAPAGLERCPCCGPAAAGSRGSMLLSPDSDSGKIGMLKCERCGASVKGPGPV